MRITQGEIARRVGVSQVTVSKVLNRSRAARISPDKRREIMSLSRQLGYKPRNLTTRTIGYVVPIDDLSLEGEVLALQQAQKVLAAQDYRLMLIDANMTQPHSLRQMLSAKSVDGVIFSRWMGGKIKKLLAPEIPYVVTSFEEGIPREASQFTLDIERMTRQLTRYVLSFGHRRLCLVASLPDIPLAVCIKEGFHAAFADCDLAQSDATVIEADEPRDIAALLSPVMESANAPTALIGVGPDYVLATLNFLHSRQLRVPNDVSLASLLYSPRHYWQSPAITSTTEDELIGQAVDYLLRKIEGPDLPPEKVFSAGKIVERESVSTPK